MAIGVIAANTIASNFLTKGVLTGKEVVITLLVTDVLSTYYGDGKVADTLLSWYIWSADWNGDNGCSHNDKNGNNVGGDFRVGDVLVTLFLYQRKPVLKEKLFCFAKTIIAYSSRG